MHILAQRLVLIAAWLIAGIILMAVGLWMFGRWHDEWSGYNASTTYGYCNVALVPITGDVIPYAGYNKDGYKTEAELPPSVNPDDVVRTISYAAQDPSIKAILVRIDSFGGTAAAAEIIAEALANAPVPVVALVREAATSAGYLIAAGTDHIIASPFSDVGSIGVTMSYLEQVEKNEQEGVRYVPLSSAPFKDYGSPDKELTADERALIERDLAIYHEHFVALIARYRAMPLEEMQKLADGSSMPGSLALQVGLIDALGTQKDALAWLAQAAGAIPEDMVVCE